MWFSVGKSKWAPTMNRLIRSLSFALVSTITTATLAQAPTHQVRITPTTQPENSTSIEIASDHWTARGYDLRSLIAEIYDVDTRRIDLPSNATTARYDVSLAFPEDQTDEATKRTLQQALQSRFGLTITPETRAMDVYVITAPNGPGPALHPHTVAATEDTPQFSFQGRDCPGISSGGISASAGTISDFRRTLEPNLDRLLVNETNLPGAYDFKIGEYRSREELFQLLRNQLGLVVTPTRRSVEILAVHPQQSSLQAGLDIR
jgi:uncharacterized protein (TIGR03435 family)